LEEVFYASATLDYNERHSVFYLSVCPSVRPSVPPLPNVWTRCF